MVLIVIMKYVFYFGCFRKGNMMFYWVIYMIGWNIGSICEVEVFRLIRINVIK